MSEGSTRGGRSISGPLVLAVIFLALLGGGVGYSLGRISPHRQTVLAQLSASRPGPTQDGSSLPVTDVLSPATRCPAHIENLAAAGTLTQVLYLHTENTEVWICRDTGGTLFYQGHRGPVGEQLNEGSNALFLTTVQPEEGGYVATYTDPQGRVTLYHVKPHRIIREYRNYPTPKPSEIEDAVD
jgi:hypothetical protein